MLESLLEIDDRFFTLPRMNSLNDKHNLDSVNFDCASLAELNSMSDKFLGDGQAPMQSLIVFCFDEKWHVTILPSIISKLSQIDNAAD